MREGGSEHTARQDFHVIPSRRHEIMRVGFTWVGNGNQRDLYAGLRHVNHGNQIALIICYPTRRYPDILQDNDKHIRDLVSFLCFCAVISNRNGLELILSHTLAHSGCAAHTSTDHLQHVINIVGS